MNPSIQFLLQVCTDFANTLPPSVRAGFQRDAQAHLQELNKLTPETAAEIAKGTTP
jgi:hypothetical protein